MQIGRILFGECILTGAVGGAIGAGLAYWMFSGGVTLGPVLNGIGALWVTPASALGGLAVAIGVSVLSGLIPIIGALRTAPALALRAVV
jgi:ABC-type antimicrobial peptide transport system permease subunit